MFKIPDEWSERKKELFKAKFHYFMEAFETCPLEELEYLEVIIEDYYNGGTTVSSDDVLTPFGKYCEKWKYKGDKDEE